MQHVTSSRPSDAAIRALPKVELHQHLDCSIDFEVARALGLTQDEAEFDSRFRAPERCRDLAEFLACVPRSLEALQTEKALALTADKLAERTAQENVVYSEIRIAPQQHIEGEMRLERVVELCLERLDAAAQRFDVGFGLILCTLRHHDTRAGLEVVELAKRYADRGVVGIDIAGDEAGFELDPHVPVFDKAHDYGLNVTAHAGEALGAVSVVETIERLRPHRIGHGVRAIEDPGVVDLLIEKNIHLEVCPLCNIQLSVFPSMEEHPIDALTKRGVSTGINTDSRTVARSTLFEEYASLRDVFGWGLAEMIAANRRAAERAFLPSHLRERVFEQLDPADGLAA